MRHQIAALNAEAVIRSKRNPTVRIPHDERRRIPLAETVLSNTRWHAWTAMRFGSRFNDVKIVSGINKHPHDLRGTVVTRCCVAGPTDEEIADVVGWDTSDIASVRRRYANNSRVVIAIAERIAKAEGL